MSAAAVAAIGCLAVLAAPTAALASPCPNEPLRLGPSALLPGCRAYEMVSPVDKNKGNVSPGYNVFASPTGDRATFSSTAAFAGSPAAVLNTGYLSKREESDWSTEGIDLPFYNAGNGLIETPSPASSPDLTKTLQLSTEALTPGAIEGGSNLYIRNNLTGTRQLVVALPGHSFYEHVAYNEHFYLTGNSDWSSILFESTLPLTGETSEGVLHLYEYQDGDFELVDPLPQEPSEEHGVAPIEPGAANLHELSTDGSRVFFTPAGGPGEGVLYMREKRAGVSKVIPISTDHRPGPKKGERARAAFGAASADGSVVYFTSGQSLTPGAVEVQGSEILYRYDVDTTELTDVTPTSESTGPQVKRILGVGDDGSDLYFTAGGALAEGAVAASTNVNIYVLDPSGEIKFIGATSPTTGESTNPRQWLTSSNGRYLAFTSLSPLTSDVKPGSEAACPFDGFLGNQAGECFEVFRFDSVADQLECVSCSGTAPTGYSLIGGLRYRREEHGLAAPDAVLDNGTVFLESFNALLPGDINETRDVYAVGGGRAELISTGASPQPSYFGDATPDGSSVFFLTAQPLVKADVDSSVDVYVDREGGGFSSQWPPGAPGACEGEGCRGDGPSAPTPLPAGSAGAGEGCDALIVNSERAGARADALARKSRKATHGKTAAAKKRAHRLRRQARTQQLKAKRIEKQAKFCRRQGK